MQTIRSFFILLCVCSIALAAQATHAQDLRITRVIDGDTFELSDGVTVRLIGVDTPESYYSYKLKRDSNRSKKDTETIRKYGVLATSYASTLALNKRVQLVFDDANIVTDHKDRFGRTLAYVNILDENGNAIFSLNDRLIFDGYANAYTNYPFARMKWYRDAERLARAEERGFWNPSFDVDEELNRPADGILYITRTGSKYHRGHCHSLRYSRMTLSQSNAGDYQACRICKPPVL